MTSLRNNHKDAVSLMIGEYRRLQDHNLNHDLLKYVCDFSDDDFQYSPDEKIRQEFEHIYASDKGATPISAALISYFVDLRNASDKIEGIDRTPKPKQPIKFMKNLEEI